MRRSPPRARCRTRQKRSNRPATAATQDAATAGVGGAAGGRARVREAHGGGRGDDGPQQPERRRAISRLPGGSQRRARAVPAANVMINLPSVGDESYAGGTTAELTKLLETIDRTGGTDLAACRPRDAARAGGVVAVALAARSEVLRYDEPARILDGRPIAAMIRARVAAPGERLQGPLQVHAGARPR